MRRLLMVSLASTLISSQAFASKARMIALGQDENGSPYIEDTRMIFLNPALLHELGNFANFEMGSSAVPSTPNAEGGLFRKVGNFKLGLQLGRESNASTNITAISALIGPTPIHPHDTFELMVAGDGGAYKWGASVLYGSAEDKETTFPNKKSQALELRGGLVADKWHGYAHLDLIGTSENETAAGQTAKFETDPSLRAGGAYDLSKDQVVYADVVWRNGSVRQAGATADNEVSLNQLTAGWVEFLHPSEQTMLFYTAGLTVSNSKLKGIAGSPDTKSEELFIPVIVGVEAEASSWLTLRASVQQNVLISKTEETETDHHNPNSTTVAAGAGVHWKDLMFDGTLAGSTTGNVDANELLANASLTYLF